VFLTVNRWGIGRALEEASPSLIFEIYRPRVSGQMKHASFLTTESRLIGLTYGQPEEIFLLPIGSPRRWNIHLGSRFPLRVLKYRSLEKGPLAWLVLCQFGGCWFSLRTMVVFNRARRAGGLIERLGGVLRHPSNISESVAAPSEAAPMPAPRRCYRSDGRGCRHSRFGFGR